MSTSDKSISSKSSSPSNNVTMLSAPCANKQAQRPVSADSNGNGNGNASDRLGASSWQQRAAVVDEADEDDRRPDDDDASSSSSPNGEEEEDVDEETDENRAEGVASTAAAAAASVAALRLMPHDKHALNFLVNEYLLENNYKMTSVAFSEENESQDLEDWDVVGVNRCKPPSIAELYKMHYMMRGSGGQAHARVARRPTIVSAKQRTVADTTAKSKTKTEATTTTKRLDDKEVQTTSVSTTETASDAATTLTRCTIETATQTTTNQAEVAVEKCDVGQLVNLDRDAQERQRSQIAALVDRQAILIGSIGKLESELAALNAHRHTHLKRIAQLE